eukprot:INCI19237.1.p1 GENE.INCI19237.1~~INCI19237.1.p1  ORF type:complete len:341 (-),score=37.03 INCI19237.1:64-1086(-)
MVLSIRRKVPQRYLERRSVPRRPRLPPMAVDSLIFLRSTLLVAHTSRQAIALGHVGPVVEAWKGPECGAMWMWCKKIDGWMCELAAWKLSDLFDVASRLHVGRRSRDNRAEDAFGVARGVLSGAGGVGGNSDHDVAAEVARVRSCREQLVELIVESRHRHLRRWRRMAATQSSKPGRILVATGALDIDVFLHHGHPGSRVSSPSGASSFRADRAGRQLYYRVPLRKENSTITGSVELRLSHGTVLDAAQSVAQRIAVYAAPRVRLRAKNEQTVRSPAREKSFRERKPKLFVNTGSPSSLAPGNARSDNEAGDHSIAPSSHVTSPTHMEFHLRRIAFPRKM